MEKIDVAILVKRLNEASDAYYNGSEPIMDDVEFDELMERLKKAETETGIVLSNSPTRRVGVAAMGEKVQHDKDHPMLSLDKCHTVQELIDFAGDDDCYLSIKCDGLSTRLCYKCTNGKTAHLVSAATRGTGVEGSNIFEHIHYYDNIPLSIPYGGDFIIDGESVILEGDFQDILKTAPQYKNSRNLASGTLANQDMNIVKQRHMKFIAWRVIKGFEKNTDSHLCKLLAAKDLGFTVVPAWLYDKDTVEAQLHNLRKQATETGLPMDGTVLAKCSDKLSNSMGRTDKFFRHSIAYKYDDDEYETKLLGIDWTIGKTGSITPTAIFKAVDIDGSTVERASLCNLSIVKNLGITNNCTVFVKKCNCIIPKITRCLHDGNFPIEIPKYCPICGVETTIVKENESEVLMCTNANCSGKILGKLVYAVSKKALNIDGLSEATLEFLISKGWVSSIKDIYHLSSYKSEWERCEGFGKTSVSNILAAIEKSRTVDLAHFITALSIPTIGSTASKIISDYCDGDFNRFVDATLGKDKTGKPGFSWTSLPTFGETMAKNIDNWIGNYGDDMCLLAEEMNFITKMRQEVKENPFLGKTIVVTGALTHFTRDTINAKIAEIGAKTAGSVSKKTDYLLTNEASGSSKYRKAIELNVPVISEDEFLRMIGD